MTMIEVNDLTKTYRVFQKKEGVLGAMRGLYRRDYKEVTAVDRISFTIEPGEMVAFLGPNGAGKTTTLKMLSGLIYPTAGEARVLDFIPWKRADRFRRQFSLVMGQKNQLWWDLPAGDSFQLHREIYSIPPAEFERTLAELDRAAGRGKADQAGRSRAVAGRADEDGADRRAPARAEIAAARRADHRPGRRRPGGDPECLRDYHAQRGVTMLLTSHYMRDVEALCDRVLVITRGTLVYDGPLSGIVEKFSESKLVRLQFEELAPDDLGRFGEVVRREGFFADIKIERARVAELLGAILDRHALADVSVEDPPLEEVIAKVFEEARLGHDAA